MFFEPHYTCLFSFLQLEGVLERCLVVANIRQFEDSLQYSICSCV